MKIDVSRVVFFLILRIYCVTAWGFIGHELVGALAQELLLPSTLETVMNLLPVNERPLSKAATWADRVKSKQAYKWSQPLHYINTNDDPPRYCNVDFSTDCTQNCAIKAIINATDILSNSKETKLRRQESLLMLIHIVGDLHQPFHVLGLGEGGNSVKGTFGGNKFSMHQIWDTMLLDKRLKLIGKSDYLDVLKSKIAIELSYAATCAPEDNAVHALITDTKTSLLACFTDYLKQYFRYMFSHNYICPFKWAYEVNQYHCTDGTLNFTQGEDLSLDYYDRHIEAIERFIILAGVRLAGILNQIL
ncbi:phospholipase C/P1 nuclease [Rozella allomycis CSF55]|uniref:Phospholipase C/P1 nuclease n=1 Tax=Rozella allomycis (strain CSF55) TaxID=988480 RepID=A0A075AWE8_ROZAC|nr:Phospholipase C/P1 nuclease domain-containing protein [Rozella allomycis CSF55]RKP21327.1 phospholipase C/P1 nuclease [Rozella allomycis CSF55]|eukprot:EPZ34610.1 Phospholipase C/P1 nuclease domain-containing protein [Rozella allomycis CSF55]